MDLIAAYANGNCSVSVYHDGTKTRSWPDGQSPTPEWPESVDMKLTNKCEEACPYCHESCTAAGAEFEPEAFDRLAQLLGGSPRGIEVALGGGNLLTYSGFSEVVDRLHRMGCIVNATVSAAAYTAGPEGLDDLIRSGRLTAVGLSYAGKANTPDTPNLVWHFIAGVHNPAEVYARAPTMQQVLILGYKRHGRGTDYLPEPVLSARLREWQYWLPRILRRGGVSFDNLALEQLQVQRFVRPEVWSSSYMGNDGQFTMYLDMVSGEYAISSNSKQRYPIGRKNLKECFAHVRELAAAL